MAVIQEPIISRLDRLDNLMRHLEEMKLAGGSLSIRNRGSPSSTPSTTPSTATSEGQYASSFLTDCSPTKVVCRPIDDVILETEYKGTLLDRVARIEDRMFKVCKQLEEDMEASMHHTPPAEVETRDKDDSISKKKGFKQLFKSCLNPKPDKLRSH